MNQPTTQQKPTTEPRDWEGECVGKVIEWKHHKINDKPCLLVLFGCITGPLRGRRIEWCGWFTEAAIEMTLRALEAGGYLGTGVTRLEGFGSKNVQLKIGTEWSKDQVPRAFPRVEWVNKIRTLDKAKGLAATELSQIDDMIAKHKPKARPSAVDTTGADDYDVDDEIPFR